MLLLGVATHVKPSHIAMYTLTLWKLLTYMYLHFTIMPYQKLYDPFDTATFHVINR